MEIINAGFYSHHPTSYTSKRRCVKHFEFELCTSFGSVAHFNRSAYTRNPNDVYVGMPGDVRFSEGNYDCYFLYLNASDEDGDFFRYLKALPHCIHVKDCDKFIRYMQEFCDLFSSPETEEQNALLRLKVNAFVLELYLSRENMPFSFHQMQYEALYRDAEAYILQHFTEPIGALEVASYIGVSVGLLYKVFRVCARLTPCGLIRAKRLEFAKNELAFSDKPISKISLECGFSEENYLNYAFSKAFHMTPLQFRKRFRGR